MAVQPPGGGDGGPVWGSDHLADLIGSLDVPFVSFNPGASFRGLEESIVNYRGNDPTVIETTHEGLSVAIAHGYAKATGEPGVCVLHDVVGTLHGTMGLFNAYCDRVPLLALSGTGPMRKSKRRPWIEWIHTALVQGNLVREFVKWDDQPTHLDGAAESLLRAYRIADTPPKGPTYVTFDHDLQEEPLEGTLDVPDPDRYAPPTRMAPDPAAIEAVADRLVAAERPVALVDQLGDSATAVTALGDLADGLGLAVFDPRRRRFNLPNTHPMDLTGTDVYREADLVLGLDLWSPNYTLKDTDRTRHELTEAIGGPFDFIDIGMQELEASSLIADYFAMRDTELSVLADTSLALPALRDAVRDRLDADPAARRRAEARRDRLAEQHAVQRRAWREEAEAAWDETPISIPRLASEVWSVIQDDPWVLVNGTLRGWTHRLWEIDDYDQYFGGSSGGGGVGYGIGAAIGGALAYAATDRLPVNLQRDGGLLYYPGGLWTVAHYELPLFTVVHNNRAYYNSTEHRMRLAAFRGRDDSLERARIGTGLWDPTPDYAALAESFGVTGYGPVEDPAELRPALEAAWDDVRAGRPALVDVVSQPR